MVIIKAFHKILILLFTGLSVGQLHAGTKMEMIPVESITEVPFKQTSRFGEKISYQVHLRDFPLWGRDEYRYKGKLQIQEQIFEVDVSKKITAALEYKNSYYLICFHYFGSIYDDIDFYIIPKREGQTARLLTITEIPTEILQYSFPSQDENFLGQYEVGVLFEMIDSHSDLFVDFVHNYVATGRGLSALISNKHFQTNLLYNIYARIKEKKYTNEQQKIIFDAYIKILWSLPKLKECSMQNYDWIIDTLLLISPKEGREVMINFLDRCQIDNSLSSNTGTKNEIFMEYIKKRL